MYVVKLTITIWFEIPIIDIGRCINYLYVIMKIFIYKLEFTYLKHYSVAMLLNIVSPE